MRKRKSQENGKKREKDPWRECVNEILDPEEGRKDT